MIDLHCHILPGVDDGSPDMETSLAMARMAQQNGVRAIVATPHCSRDFPEQNLLTGKLIDCFEKLNEEVADSGLMIRIYPGMEIMVNEQFEMFLNRGLLLPLAGTSYMLIEFDFDCAPETVEHAMKCVMGKGYIPMIAHPERYYCVQWAPELAESWRRSGAVIQLNRGSIQGKLTEQAEACAWELLKSGTACVIASDAHSVFYRRPELRSVFLEVADHFSWAYASELLIHNPERILKNQMIVHPLDSIMLPE